MDTRLRRLINQLMQSYPDKGKCQSATADRNMVRLPPLLFQPIAADDTAPIGWFQITYSAPDPHRSILCASSTVIISVEGSVGDDRKPQRS
jgi:hypothetical protein